MKTKILYTAMLLLFVIGMQAQQEQVMRAELPSGVRKFLSKNFRSPFHHAVKQANNNTVSYDIVLNDQTKIQFTQDGTWKCVDGKGKAVKCKFLGKQINDYVIANYPSESVTRIEAAKSHYKLQLTNGKVLMFAMDGTPIKKA